MEMKREPVQEEGQRTKERDQSEVESTSNLHADISIERILEAEKRVDCKLKEMNFTALAVNIRAVNIHPVSWCECDQIVWKDQEKMNKCEECYKKNCLTHICHTTVEQLLQIFSWARHIPHFISLPLEDQVCLLKNGWNELLIAAFSHRSMDVKDKDSIVLTVSMTVHRTSAQQAGAVGIFDRILSELVAKMREMKMDRTELECLSIDEIYLCVDPSFSSIPKCKASNPSRRSTCCERRSMPPWRNIPAYPGRVTPAGLLNCCCACHLFVQLVSSAWTTYSSSS
ncbi:retinoic acid receptor RXR-alpha-A-like isoform X2 [Linepithema humile]|uniref:retinoic acid receptor RXR-alpha-A-like isoform X2 n=1 Tax=Linepithema humile TaxID=83485 RepID=UPI00351F28C7